MWIIDQNASVLTRSTRTATPRPANSRAGFTLIESLIASVILAFGSLSLAVALLGVQSQTEMMEGTYDASDAARQLMEEIVSRPLVISSGTNNPGWPQGTHLKAAYDDIFDYHEFHDVWPNTVTFADTRTSTGGSGRGATAPGAGAAVIFTPDASTTSTPHAATECRRWVTVQYVNPPSASVLNNGDFAVITVNALPTAGGATVTLTRYVSAIAVTR